MKAQYWVAQYVKDPFRNEPRNVGVFVQLEDEFKARFYGEVDESNMDGRKIRTLPYPEVYRQWVTYWRKSVSKNNPDEIVKSTSSHYRVIEGGEITEVQSESMQDALSYLYAILVSDGGLTEAMGLEKEESEQIFLILENEIISTLRTERLLEESGELFVKHPIRRHQEVQGTSNIFHKPSFVQENGTKYIMETVDFTMTHKKRARDHAGWAAYMFSDITDNFSDIEPIAIIKMEEADSEIEDVYNGLVFLQNEGRIVNWLIEREREEFLKERKEIAEYSV